MQTTTKLKTILLERQPKLLISQRIFDQIRFLCRCIPKVEWSGVLFYKISGAISNREEDFVMEVVDIFLMDKGTSGYTEYTYDGDIAEFMMDKSMEDPETWMSIKMGHIHSHNTMGVFFSGTDWDELYDNCGNHNFYLSLIVNNYMDMIAKLVYRGVPVVVTQPDTYTALDENGDQYTITLAEPKEIKSPPILFEQDCVLTVPEREITVDEKFQERINYIIDETERKAKLAEEAKKKQSQEDDWKKKNGNKTGNRYAGTNFSQRGSNFNPNNGNNGKLLPVKGGSEDGHFKGAFGGNNIIENLVTEDELFLCYILRMGDKEPDDTLEAALDAVELTGIESKILANTIVDNYAVYYERFFREFQNVEMEDFLDNVTLTIETLDDYTKYKFVPVLIEALKAYGFKLEAMWKEQNIIPS